MTNEEAREVLGDVRAYLASRASLENEMLAGHTFIDICNAIKALEQQPCEDAISREDAINALRKALYDYEDKTEKQFKESKELNLEDWFQHRIFVQNMNDIDIQTILELPPVKQQPKIDEIIKRIEEARDKDKIAEYPYNRCIDIVREVLGNEKDRKD